MLKLYLEFDKKRDFLYIIRKMVDVLKMKYGSGCFHGVDAAGELYDSGRGGRASFKSPFGLGVIEVQSSVKYPRIPKGKLYVYVAFDWPFFTGQGKIDAFVRDAVVLFESLRPRLGLAALDDFFENDGAHFLRPLSVFPLMFFSRELVSSIGVESFRSLEGIVYEVRGLVGGGFMVRLVRSSPSDRGSWNVEFEVTRRLGLKGDFAWVAPFLILGRYPDETWKKWLNKCVIERVIRIAGGVDLVVRCGSLEPFRVYDPYYFQSGKLKYGEGDTVLAWFVSNSGIRKFVPLFRKKRVFHFSEGSAPRGVVKFFGQLAAAIRYDDVVVYCGIFVFAFDMQKRKAEVGDFVEVGNISQIRVVRKL